MIVREFYDDIPLKIQSKLSTSGFIDKSFVSEISDYLSKSFGDRSRIGILLLTKDYGTGHELNFILFLYF